MKPGVSVLMPALNEEKTIAGTIERVLQQQDVEVELLVVHGQSVDRTGEILDGIAARDPRVRVIPNPRNLIPIALNLGLDAARHEFVARIDAHSEVSPDYLSRGVAWLRRDDRLASVGGRRKGVAFTPVGRAIALTLSSPAAIGDSINHFATEPQLTDHASWGVTRAAAARAIGGWDESLLVNEDVDFDHRLIQAGHLIGFDPAMVIGWHVQETLPRLFRQYRRYGRGKGQMIRKNGAGAIRLRHLVPPGFVAAGGLLLVAGLARPAVWLLLAPYGALVALASVKAWRTRDRSAETSAAVLPASFAAVHTGWGLGMLEALAFNRQPYLASGNSQLKTATPTR